MKMTIYLFIVWTVYIKYFPSQKTVDLYTVFLVQLWLFSHSLLNRFILLNIVGSIIKRAYVIIITFSLFRRNFSQFEILSIETKYIIRWGDV